MKYTLAFDVYGTLIDTSGVFHTLEAMIGEKTTDFMNTWRNKQLEYSFRRAAMVKYVDFSLCTHDALEYSSRKFKINLDKSQTAKLMENYQILPVFPDVISCLEELRGSGHRLFAFSNGSNEALSTLLTNAEIIEHFDDVVSVEDVKMFKPSPVVYQYFNQKSNSTRSDSWLISGNPFDVIGAASYGMHTAWVQRSPDQVFDPWNIHPTLVIPGLSVLSAKLQLI